MNNQKGESFSRNCFDSEKEKLIPFALSVGKIAKNSGQFDSRIRTARIPLLEHHSFRDMVRLAVLDRVTKMSGPLKN